MGHVIVATAAVRDEGTSYHYLPASREVAPTDDAVAAIVATLERHEIPFVTGKTWTTDALYRETRGKVARRAAEGCLTVEMEAAAFFAVARFRGVSFGQMLYAGDDLSGDAWDDRGLAGPRRGSPAPAGPGHGGGPRDRGGPRPLTRARAGSTGAPAGSTGARWLDRLRDARPQVLRPGAGRVAEVELVVAATEGRWHGPSRCRTALDRTPVFGHGAPHAHRRGLLGGRWWRPGDGEDPARCSCPC